MTYCPTHERALIPAGYDLRARVSASAHWHPLPASRLAYALAWAEAGGMVVVIRQGACDVCTAAREKAA